MTTITIPTMTLPVGTQDFGPTPVADNVTLAVLTIDRTVTNGFNNQPASTQASIEVHESTDGGATWLMIVAATIVGGSYINHHTGLPYTASSVFINLAPATGREMKARMVISGASVAVAGSLTIT